MSSPPFQVLFDSRKLNGAQFTRVSREIGSPALRATRLARKEALIVIILFIILLAVLAFLGFSSTGAKDQLSKYLTFANSGEEVVIRDRDRPMAKLAPFLAESAEAPQ